MTGVVLREVTPTNFAECIGLQVEPAQRSFVATNMKSLAEAKVNSTLYPLAIYDEVALGDDPGNHNMVGFTMYELTAGVGFILRLMIDARYQRKGYGRASMIEVIRRLRCYPEVQLIATSHRRENLAAADLYQGLGFEPWQVPFDSPDPDEVYLALTTNTP